MSTGRAAPGDHVAPYGPGTPAPRQGSRGSVDHALVDRWRQEAERRHSALRRTILVGSEDLAPGITVIVPTYRGHNHLEHCLQSLAAQTLDRSMFEVILVPNGPVGDGRDLIDRFRKSHPDIDVRVIELPRAGASRARNAGLAGARRQYTTFVDDDDYVSPRFLEVLLAHAGPRVVPVVPVVDVHPSGEEEPDNYINRALAPHRGTLVSATAVPRVTSFNAAKVVATEVVRQIRYDGDLASGEDVVFWTTVAVRGRVEFLPCGPESGAIYYRRLRGGSVSRQESGFDVEVNRRLDVLVRLDPLLAEGDAAGSALVRDRIAQVTSFVNSYLTRKPAAHPSVVTELDRRPILHVPYDRLNRGMARGLAVAYAFPPYADTSAVVTAKRLRSRAQVADVVCNAMDRIRATDHSTRRISGPYVEHQEYVDTPPAFDTWPAMEAFAVEGLRRIRERRRAGGYEWLYSRAQFAASHFLAAAYKLTHPDVRWVAEFSDPLSRNVLNQVRGKPVEPGTLIDLLSEQMRRRDLPLPDSRNSMVWAEELAYVLADEVVFTNEHQRDYMLSYCSRGDVAEAVRDTATISPQPTLPPPFYSMVDCRHLLPADRINIGYFGHFYANREAGDLLSAFAALDRQTRARLRLHVFTTDPKQVVREAAERGLADTVQAGPYLGYLEFLNLTTKLDALVVADAATAGRHERNPFLPSKWSDYRGSGTPVWGMVEEGSALSEQPLDYASPLGDPGAGAEMLSKLVPRADR